MRRSALAMPRAFLKARRATAAVKPAEVRWPFWPWMAAAAACLIGPACAWAEDLPKRKAGLWEITERAEGDASAFPPAHVCIDEASEPLLNNINMITGRARCSSRKTRTIGGVLNIETICEFRNSEVKTRAMVTIPDSTTYHIEAEAVYMPALFGQRVANRVQDGRWIGACPPNMNPGDIAVEGMPKRNLAEKGETGGPSEPLERAQ